MSKFKLLFVYLGILIAVIGFGYWLFTSSAKQEANMPGQFFESQGQEHIAQGATEHLPYSSNPPTSGPHWPQPAEWGIYKATQPDEQLVHNLEHGGIWISYKPEMDADTVAKLEDFTRRYPLIVVEPRPANTSPISLAAWTRLQHLESYDERAILEFIEAYHNKGPEKVM
jgi:hypothetical protein